MSLNNKQKGSTECGYVIHGISTIILEGFKDNWEMVIIYYKTNSISYNGYYLDSYINLCFIISCSILLIKDDWNQR